MQKTKHIAETSPVSKLDKDTYRVSIANGVVTITETNIHKSLTINASPEQVAKLQASLISKSSRQQLRGVADLLISSGSHEVENSAVTKKLARTVADRKMKDSDGKDYAEKLSSFPRENYNTAVTKPAKLEIPQANPEALAAPAPATELQPGFTGTEVMNLKPEAPQLNPSSLVEKSAPAESPIGFTGTEIVSLQPEKANEAAPEVLPDDSPIGFTGTEVMSLKPEPLPPAQNKEEEQPAPQPVRQAEPLLQPIPPLNPQYDLYASLIRAAVTGVQEAATSAKKPEGLRPEDVAEITKSGGRQFPPKAEKFPQFPDLKAYDLNNAEKEKIRAEVERRINAKEELTGKPLAKEQIAAIKSALGKLTAHSKADGRNEVVMEKLQKRAGDLYMAMINADIPPIHPMPGLNPYPSDNEMLKNGYVDGTYEKRLIASLPEWQSERVAQRIYTDDVLAERRNIITKDAEFYNSPQYKTAALEKFAPVATALRQFENLHSSEEIYLNAKKSGELGKATAELAIETEKLLGNKFMTKTTASNDQGNDKTVTAAVGMMAEFIEKTGAKLTSANSAAAPYHTGNKEDIQQGNSL